MKVHCKDRVSSVIREKYCVVPTETLHDSRLNKTARGHICRMKDEILLKTAMPRMHVKSDRPRNRPAKMVRWHSRLVRCSSTLPESVQLALERSEWTEITGLNSISSQEDDYIHVTTYLEISQSRSESLMLQAGRVASSPVLRRHLPTPACGTVCSMMVIKYQRSSTYYSYAL